MPSASRLGAYFRVEFDDATSAEDLEHTSSDTGRALAQRERDKLTAEGTWGMVFQLRIGSDRRPFLACLAFGTRHPTGPGALSVYQIAHQRIHGQPPRR